MSRLLPIGIGVLLLMVHCTSPQENSLPETVDFNLHIRPILSDRCFACHGPDKNARKADLRLDLPEMALRQRLESGGHAFVPGKPLNSEAYQRMITEDPELLMPPPESQLTLSQGEIDLIERWIAQGAEYKEHWAFIPPERKPIPEIQNIRWVRTPMDALVLSKLAQQGLRPATEASQPTLLRRLSFDLTGLPPSVAELDAFLQDSSESAFEKVVDRLLESPHYGEHMAVSWMDLARYADTHGYTVDRYRPAWPWRDWVIQAFNQNMPYDQFVSWQLAGDLMPKASKAQRIATAFNRNHSQNAEGGIVNEEFQVEYVADRTQTFATAFLGLTMDCARCHDHKYDPLSQKDYYQLFSYFNQVDESGQITFSTRDMPAPTELLPDEAVEKKKAFLEQKIQQQEKGLEAYVKDPTLEKVFGNWLDQHAPISNNMMPEGLVAHYSLERGDLETIPNQVQGGADGKITDPVTGRLAEALPTAVEGPAGMAWQLNGDEALDFPGVGRFTRSDPFSVGLWVKVPEDLGSGVVFHANKGGIIYNFKGYQVSVEKGYWDVRLAHAFPYNAIHLVSRDTVQTETWQHIMLTYDGSGKAAGVTLYLNGDPVPVRVAQDQLYKEIIFVKENIDTHLKVGARWRTRGFRGGVVDEIVVYGRELSPWEVGFWAGKRYAASNVSPLTAIQRQRIFPYFLSTQASYQAQLDSLRKQRHRLSLLVENIPEIMVIAEREIYRPTFVLERGAYDAPGEEVFPTPPSAIKVGSDNFASDRLGLTRWLFHPQNPLAARVVANRIWQQCFGQGLVKTSEDFGNQGTLPAHPELLDHLALYLIDSGWDLKALLKYIVMSSTYRQVGSQDTKALQQQAQGLFAQGPSGTLSAEMLRDQALFASGLMNDSVGGPSVKPYQPPGLWRVNSGRYQPDSGANLYRRSLYTFWKRTVPPPTMNTFDAPSRSYCLVRRQKTSTPLQALTLMNDPQFQEAARVLGQKILHKGFTPDEGISYAFRSFTSRFPTAEEQGVLREQYNHFLEIFVNDPEKARGWLEVGEYPIPDSLDQSALAAYTVVNSTIMNQYEAARK